MSQFSSIRGNSVVPTGKIAVRFKKSPSNEELRHFAKLGLTLDARNEFVPSQVTFRVTDKGRRSVLDVVEQIQEHAADVLRAWPETMGYYRRG